MPIRVSDPRVNALLGALPADDFARLLPQLESIALVPGQSLFEAGERMRHVYFPLDSIVSLLYVMKSGASAEIASAGREGMVGVALFMGGDSTPSRAIVQCAGSAARIPAEALKNAFNASEALRDVLLRYTQALLTQMAQTAVCNRHHLVQQQLCRWLLVSLDRLSSGTMEMTQEVIATLLGVRREAVTEAAGRLQHDGVIQYRRGRITVLDRPALEARACECYAVVKREYVRLLDRG